MRSVYILCFVFFIGLAVQAGLDYRADSKPKELEREIHEHRETLPSRHAR
jgi:hypothetical protein